MQNILKIFLCLMFFACGKTSKELTEEARLLLQKQRYEEAILLLNKAIDKNSKNADAFNARGVALFELGKYNDARLDYEQAIRLDSSDYKPFYNLAELYRVQKKYTEALQNYNKAIQRNAEVADLYVNRGVSYYNLQDTTQALTDFRKAVSLQKDNKQAWFNLGNLLFFSQNPEHIQEAALCFETTINLDTTFQKAYVNLAQSYLRLNQKEKACQKLLKAKTMNNAEAIQLYQIFCTQP
ncbi:tetratricopeptide repeat protein [Raineya orbicola]|jgi:tetratricopeptide (TPR) repeat protein|uniref:TPR repeat n=1 Tax=Raineya orbicola TaxID=2016530 RepID=A0A2N3II55_9BACT|nr:tetratricopeptide repeat protein [Raineya orbicola]PKQ70015.1 TPR repeat [Raineya orbicola]